MSDQMLLFDKVALDDEADFIPDAIRFHDIPAGDRDDADSAWMLFSLSAQIRHEKTISVRSMSPCIFSIWLDTIGYGLMMITNTCLNDVARSCQFVLLSEAIRYVRTANFQNLQSRMH